MTNTTPIVSPVDLLRLMTSKATIARIRAIPWLLALVSFVGHSPLTNAQGSSACEVDVDTEVVAQYPFPASGDPLDAVLVNTRQYVMGSLVRPDDESDGEATFRCECEDCDEASLTHLVQVHVKPKPACGSNDGHTAWSGQIDGEVAGEPFSSSLASDDPYLCLPEGLHQMTLSGRLQFGAQEIPIEETRIPVPVKNYLFVAIGDSYASGEGTPAARATPSQWPFVDDDDKDKLEHLVGQGKRVTALWQRQSFAKLPLEDKGTRVELTPWDSQKMQHFLAHRSPFAPASLAAMAFEAEDPDSSVTFVNLAESGATIERGALDAGCIPESNCAARFDGSQVARLSDLVKGRSIDALIVGFGGNDAGFARVAAAYIEREPSLNTIPGYDLHRRHEIKSAIDTGDWSPIMELERNVAGLSALGGEYERLNAELDSALGNELAEAKVFLLGYPAPHKKPGPPNEDSSYCEFFRNIAPFLSEQADRRLADALLGIVGTGIDIALIPGDTKVRLRVDENESRYVHYDFYLPLKNAQIAAANSHGWRFVDMTGEFANHHICAGRPYAIHRRDSYEPTLPAEKHPNRWFRAGVEGFVISGSSSGEIDGNRGILHPNESGYREMSRLLRIAMQEELLPSPDAVWTEAIYDTIDGRRCPNFELPGCGDPGGACSNVGEICLDRITRNDDRECRYVTRRCEPRVCKPNAVESCDIPNGTGQRSCNEFGSGYEGCKMTSCNAGFIQIGGSCKRPACDIGQSKECTASIDNALEAFRRCKSDRSGFGSCNLVSCKPGYRPSGNKCVYDGATQPF